MIIRNIIFIIILVISTSIFSNEFNININRNNSSYYANNYSKSYNDVAHKTMVNFFIIFPVLSSFVNLGTLIPALTYTALYATGDKEDINKNLAISFWVLFSINYFVPLASSFFTSIIINNSVFIPLFNITSYGIINLASAITFTTLYNYNFQENYIISGLVVSWLFFGVFALINLIILPITVVFHAFSGLRSHKQYNKKVQVSFLGSVLRISF